MQVDIEVVHPILFLSSVHVKNCLPLVHFSCHNISIYIHVPHRVQDELYLGDARMRDKLPVLAFTMNVDFLDGRI